jgi:hypothetical protein
LPPRSRLTTGVQKRLGPEAAQSIDAHFSSKPLCDYILLTDDNLNHLKNDLMPDFP